MAYLFKETESFDIEEFIANIEAKEQFFKSVENLNPTGNNHLIHSVVSSLEILGKMLTMYREHLNQSK